MTTRIPDPPRTWISPKAKLVYHPTNQPASTEAWGVAIYEACNCSDSDHQEHWNYEGVTKYSLEEAIQALKTFWWTAA